MESPLETISGGLSRARSTALPAMRPTDVPPVESSFARETPTLRLKNVRLVKAPSPRRIRAAWVSDLHLGTRSSNAASFLDFLRKYEMETLYIVGDLIDLWQLRRGFYWPQQHNDVIQKILRKARKGTRVIYIPGNHDEFVSGFCGEYGNITIQPHAIHMAADGRRILVIHGHELDAVVQNARWLAFAGDLGYQFLLSLNPAINFVRRHFGRGYWSLSAYAKKRVKDAVAFIGEFEKAVVHYAERFGVDAVLCGHIHSASVRQIGPIRYYNCGDWVENCSALIENHDGAIELLHCLPVAQRTRQRFEPARELSPL